MMDMSRSPFPWSTAVQNLGAMVHDGRAGKTAQRTPALRAAPLVTGGARSGFRKSKIL